MSLPGLLSLQHTLKMKEDQTFNPMTSVSFDMLHHSFVPPFIWSCDPNLCFLPGCLKSSHNLSVTAHTEFQTDTHRSLKPSAKSPTKQHFHPQTQTLKIPIQVFQIQYTHTSPLKCKIMLKDCSTRKNQTSQPLTYKLLFRHTLDRTPYVSFSSTKTMTVCTYKK